MFDNKYINYSKKTKQELYQTLILFHILSNKYMVFLGKALLTTAFKLHIPIFGIIKKTIFQHFCGGETITESKKKIKNLGNYNIKTILDYSIEGQLNEDSFKKTYQEILKNLDTSNKNTQIPFCVFKITGLARFQLLEKINQKIPLSKPEEAELTMLKNRLYLICEQAEEIQTPILIDAEESWIQDAIDQLVDDLMKRYNTKLVTVYNTIQLYRWGRLAYLKKLHKKSQNDGYKLGLKLVRGAYMEKERKRAKQNKYKSPIHKTKQACDIDFNQAGQYCIDNLTDISVCFGTHNEESTAMIMDLMKSKKINNWDARIFFAQLLGMSDNISFYLGYYKYNVAKYVPYGPVKEVLPYLIRRAEENSSISGQTNREIDRIREIIKNTQ